MTTCVCNCCDLKRFASWSRRARAAKTERSLERIMGEILATLAVRHPRGIAVELCEIVVRLEGATNGCSLFLAIDRDTAATHLYEMAHSERECLKLNPEIREQCEAAHADPA